MSRGGWDYLSTSCMVTTIGSSPRTQFVRVGFGEDSSSLCSWGGTDEFVLLGRNRRDSSSLCSWGGTDGVRVRQGAAIVQRVWGRATTVGSSVPTEKFIIIILTT